MKIAPGIPRIGDKGIVNSYLVEESGEEGNRRRGRHKSRRKASRPSKE